MMAYHKFIDDEGEEYGSFEVFEVTSGSREATHEGYELGFYWWPCSPGCLPDGEPSGPFKTYREAVNDAREC